MVFPRDKRSSVKLGDLRARLLALRCGVFFTPMHTLKSFVPACLAALCVGLLLSGCGKKDASQPAASSATASTSAGAEQGNGRTIEITGNDTMKFSVVEIKAKPGEQLTVTLTNVGNAPKVAMGHNFCLFKSADLVNAFMAAAPTAAATEYIPADHKDDLIVHTKLLGPRESDTIHFAAPTAPGHYPYICSFPGHAQVGMKGELIVE